MKQLQNLLLLFILFYICIIAVTCQEEDITADGDGICALTGIGATDIEKCHGHSRGDNVCCYFELETIAGAAPVPECIEVQRNHRFILARLSTITIENKYDAVPVKTIDCKQIDRSCGVASPKELYECRKHSSTSKSCCKINFPNTDKSSQCALAQDKFGNEPITTKLLGVDVECNSFFIKLQLMFLFIAIMIVFTIIR